MNISYLNNSILNMTDTTAATPRGDMHSGGEVVYYKYIPASAFITAQLLILVLSIIGNVIVILIVVKKRRMQTFTNWLILNLAVADVYSVLICIPMEVPMDLGYNWPYGSFFCRIYYPMQTTSIYGSVFTLVSLSLSRYWAVIHPFRKQPSVKTAKYLIPIIWLLSIVVVIPYVMVLQYDPEEKFCGEIWTDKERRRYTLAIFIFQYVLPLCLICLSYAYIIYELKFRIHDTALPKEDPKRIETQKVIKLLIIITITFALCILPYHVVALGMEFGHALKFSYIEDIWSVTYIMLYSNAVLNPIIYNVFNEKFRLAFKELYISIKRYLLGKNDPFDEGFFSSRRKSTYPRYPSTYSRNSQFQTDINLLTQECST